MMGIKVSSSQPIDSELTKDFRPLNEHVHELYAPQDVPRVVVIFFHGLPFEEKDYEKAYWKTWLSRDGSVVWPKEWLPGSLSSPRILSVSYDSVVREHEEETDSYTIAQNLIQDIILDEDTRLGQDCPVVLVGHSLGGIIIKEFLLMCLTRRGLLFNNERARANLGLIDNFLENCKGVFYYSTPHHGSEFIDYLNKKGVKLNGHLMKLLNVLSSDTARINSEFANARVGENIRTRSIGETLQTTYMGFTGYIVREASSRSDTETYYSLPAADHFNVCKPKSKIYNNFKQLATFINEEAMKDKGLGLRPLIASVPNYLPKRTEAGTLGMNPRHGKNKEPYTKILQPQVIKQVNGSVWQLYAPQDRVPEVLVIFFHGLPPENHDHREAYWKTWLSRDGSIVWPKEWLPESLPSPQILSVSYNSSAQKTDGASDSYIIAENLISDIIFEGLWGQDCPVILVGHSLGGIIIKAFLYTCLKMRGELRNNKNAKTKLERIEKFLDNCKGVFYYSTPHNGSEFIDYLNEKRLPLSNLMELMKKLSASTARINSDFANARLGECIRTAAMGESLDTTYMGFNGRIVTEASAKNDIDALNFYEVANANHFDVCKATDRQSCNIFKNLLTFINESAIQDQRPGLLRKFLEQPPVNRSMQLVYVQQAS